MRLMLGSAPEMVGGVGVEGLGEGESMSLTLDLNFSSLKRFSSSFFGSLESGIVKKQDVLVRVRRARSRVMSRVFGLRVCIVLWKVALLLVF